MKAGLVFFAFAMRLLRELNVAVGRKVILQINADEETGSESSRALTEAIARQSAAVLVLEPGTGLEGKVKTARKGVGDYRITVRGQAAHAGLDFEKGANAVLEMARQVERVAGFTRLNRGVTVSPGVIRGGTRSNVVPAVCNVEIDVRAPRAADARYLERQFAALEPFDKRCRIEVTGGYGALRRSPETVRYGPETGRGTRRGAGRFGQRRRIGRQFHRGAGRPDAGWTGGCRRGSARAA
jgi:glutamate carboxypeptidase